MSDVESAADARIEVTAAMIQAGVREYVDLDLKHADVEDVVAWVYEAMERVRREGGPRSRSLPPPPRCRRNP